MTFYLEHEAFKRMVEAARAQRAPARLKGYEAVHAELRACFSGSSPRVNAVELGRACVLSYVRRGEDLHPYHQFAGTIADALRTATGAPPNEEQWFRAFEVLVAHEDVLSTLRSPTDSILRTYAEVAAIGRASVELEREGFSFFVSEKGELDLSTSERKKLGQTIDSLAARVGGKHILSWMFRVLEHSKKYDAEFNRWRLARSPDNFQGPAPEAQMPWGYLYHLGIKHFQRQGDANEEDFCKLVMFVRNSTAIMNVQPYNGMEGMVLDSESLMPFLLKSVVYDSLFTFSQFPTRNAELLLAYLAERLDHGATDGKSPTFSSVAAMVIDVLNVANPLQPKVVFAKDVARRLRRSQPRVKKLLDDMLVFSGEANAQLTYPPSSRDFALDDHTLLRVSEGVYLCPPAALCGKAAIEAFMSFARVHDKDFDSRVGPLLEAFLRKFSESRGLAPKHGKYSFGKVQSDCDFVVETGDTIVFLELKKKGLRRLSKSGLEYSDISLLVDLAQGVIKSQSQALQHATVLRKHGRLPLLLESGAPAEVVWREQRVVRVSVSLFEYGSLHDRTTLQHILQIGSSSRIELKDSAFQEQEEAVNKMLRELQKHAESAGEFSTSHPFDDCYLLSFPQLLLLLGNSTSNESFVEELTAGSRTRLASKDFYEHYRFARQLPRKSRTQPDR